tara:strand:+ start:1578 stop:3446 length:1869 start_codon:yes stop_codon:yes gene_type:complete
MAQLIPKGFKVLQPAPEVVNPVQSTFIPAGFKVIQAAPQPTTDPTAAGIPTQFATGIPTPRDESESRQLDREGPDALSRIGAAFSEPFDREFGLRRSTIDKFKSEGFVGDFFNTFNEVVLSGAVSPVVSLLEHFDATTDAGIDGIAQIAREMGVTKTSAESFKRDAKSFLMISGLVAGKPRGKTVPKIPVAPTKSVADVIEAGKNASVPVLTSDVLPPSTFVGRIMQSTAEKVPIIGTGNKRAAQQAARQDAINNLAIEQGVDLDSAFDAQIIKSLNEVKDVNQSKAVKLRQSSVERLTAPAKETLEIPNVPAERTLKAIDNEIAKEMALRNRADKKIITNLEEVRAAIVNGNFEHVGNIRTTVIKDIKALQRGEFDAMPSKAEGGLSRIKSAIDDDMKEFAVNTDRGAAADWIRSNRLFSDEFTKFKNSELKRLIAKGDITPEVVNNVIFGGKRSELNRLYNNLDKGGRSNVRQSIMQRALQKSGFPDEINPDKFLSALNQESSRKAINTFFRGPEDKALRGFMRLLEHTKRAQQSGVATPTGQQLIPLVTGGLVVSEPVITLTAASTLSGAARIYESVAVRNSLLKLATLKPGTKAFTKAAAKTGLIITAAVEAEKRQEK